MKHIFANRLLLLVSTLLISNVLFSNTFENNRTNNNYIEINSITTKLVNENFETAKVVAGPTITTQPSPSQVICAGSSVTFSVVASGTGTLTYSWKRNGTTLSDGGTISGATTATLNIANIISSDAANYTCEVTDAADPTNPTYSNPAQLTVKPLPVLIKFGNTNVCIGQSTTISISGASSYLWNTGNTSDNITVNPSLNTTYNVIGNSNGCTSSANFAIQVNPLPTISITGNTTICNGTATTLTATGATSYNWGGGLTSSSIVVSPTTNTTYTVTGTNSSNGCVKSTTETVVVNAIPSASVSATSPICAGNIATFTITGTPNALVTYNTGTGTNPTVTIDSNGTKIVSIPGATTIQTLTLVSVSLLGCQSTTFSTASATVVVNSITAAPVTSPVSYCQNNTAIALMASGTGTLKWYLSQTGGSAETSVPIPSTLTSGTFTYYVSQTIDGCESLRVPLVVTVKSLPSLPTVTSLINYCVGETSSVISATGTALQWYTIATSGTANTIAPTPNTSIATEINYFVSQTISGCEGPRANIKVVVNATPANPNTPYTSPITYCQNQTASPLLATGNSLKWYSTISGGSGSAITPTPSTTNPGTTSYFVSQTINDCESLRTQIDVLVNPTPLAPPVNSPLTYCLNDIATVLSSATVTGNTMKWYNGVTALTSAPTPNTANSGTTSYYVSEINSYTCESPRSLISVSVNALPNPPVVITSVSYCKDASAIPLSATASSGHTLKWYTVATAGTASTTAITPSTSVVGQITYYVSQVNQTTGCESARASIEVTVKSIPSMPIFTSPITLCQNQVANPLIASGSSLKWYTTSTFGTGALSAPTPSSATATTTNYYVSQTVDGCESSRGSISVTVNPTPVVPTITSVVNPTCTIPSGSLQLNNLPTTSWTVTRTPAVVSGTEFYNNSTSSYLIDNLAPGSYTFTVSNGLCTSAATGSVTIISIPTQSAPTVGIPVQPTCTVATGNVTLNDLPGNWTLTSNTGSIISGSGSSTNITSLNPGTYSYTVKNTATNCISVTSSNVVIGTQPFTPSAPSIVSPQFFITGAKVSDLQVPSGIIKWYSALTGGSVLNPLTTLATGNYYASETIGSCESSRFTAIITIDPPTNAGIVNAVGISTVCSGASASLILTGQLGTVLNWQSSSDNSTWTDIPNTSGIINYTAINLTSSLYFRAVVQSSVSSILYSTPALITVNAPSIAGTLIATNSAVCKNALGGTITLSGNNGTVVKWQNSTDGGSSWTDIVSTATVYSAPALSVTTAFRAVVKNGVCAESTTNPVTITIKDTPPTPVLTNQLACIGETKVFGTSPQNSAYDYVWTSNRRTLTNNLLSTISILFDQAFIEDITLTISPKDNTNTCIVSGTFTVSTNPLPVAAVISDATICEGNSKAIGANSVTGSYYTWSSVPAGPILSGANPIVSPGVSTTYTLVETVTNTGCTNSNDVIITVLPDPTSSITTGPSVICATQSNVFIEATVSNDFDSIAWEVVPSSAGNIYVIPNTFGKQIEFTPTAAGISATSPVIVRHTLTNKCGVVQAPVDFPITIQKQAVANAGLAVSTCDINGVQLNGAGSINATTYSWTKPTNITGQFSPDNSATPTYIPSPADVANYTGPIPFTLTVSSGSACSVNPPSTVNVTIIKKPVISAGPANTTICEGSDYIVVGASKDTNTASFVWKTSGDGQFTNGSTIAPTYTPGVQDKINETVTITLEATGNFPCTTVSSQTVLSITKKPILNYIDQVVCGSVNTPIPIVGSIQNAGIIQWIQPTNGTGTFNATNIQNPNYTPSVADMNRTIILHIRVYNQNGCNTSLYEEKYINFTINAKPMVSAGLDKTICEGQSYALTTATNSNATILWSAPSGTFNDATQPNPTFTPSPSDTSVTITITGTQPGCLPVPDNMVLTIQKKPTAIADNGLPQIICQGETFYFTGTESNSSSVKWIKESGGNSSGILNNDTSISASYTSGANESGTVTFSLTAYPLSPGCTTSTPDRAVTQVTIVAKPIVTFNATTVAQRTICEGLNYVVNSANPLYYNRLEWTTSGDGNFISGATSQTPTYRPGTGDIARGRVLLTLKAIGNTPCIDAEDSIEIIITKNPIITSFATSLDICSGVGVPVPLTDVNLDINAQNFDVLTWTSSGSDPFDGFFNANPTNTINFNSYTPTADEIANGSVNLTLKAIRNSGCNTFDDLVVTLNFIEVSVANAGPDATICEDGTYTTETASALNHTNVIWTSNGSANTITNHTSLTGMIYEPTQADIDRGTVTLTLTAYGDSCQPSATDDIIITFKKLPQITVPNDTAICESSTSYPITGVNVIDGGALTWSFDGIGGRFSDSTTLNPTYFPSAQDITRGFVNLTLTAAATGECSTPQSKSFKISFVKLPTVNAGPDRNICDLSFTVLNATATNYSAIQWTAIATGTGTGTLEPSSIDKLEAIYNPVTAQTGTVTLTLTVTPLAACLSTGTISDDMVATFIAKPTINVINQNPICADSPTTTIVGTTISNALSYEWTSTTGTTINNYNDREPEVIASPLDIENGFIDLKITATPNAPCIEEVSRIVRIIIQPLAIVTVTNDLTVCMIDADDDGQLDPKTLSATFTNRNSADASSILWEIISGTGSLEDATTETPIFKPASDTDEVKIRVSVKNLTPCTGVVFEEFILKAVQKPVVDLSKNSDTVCSSALTYNLAGNTILDPTNRVEWTRVAPIGTGNFGNLTEKNTTYTFSDEDRTNGSVTLRLTAYADPLCSALSTYEEITILIEKAPTATISSTLSVCAGEPYTATAVNPDGNTLAWIEINGNHGEFVNANLATATFNQSLNNSSNFDIQLTSTTTAACAPRVLTQTITVQPKPTIDAGASDQYNCSLQPFVISGVTGTNYDSVLWTIDGTNSSAGFSNPTVINPTFTPTQPQINAGQIVLKVTAKAKSPCGTSFDVWDTIILHFTPTQTVNFVAPAAICEGETISLVGSAPNSASVVWSTSSTAATTGFDNPTALNSVYTPSALDLGLEKVTITLTGISNSNCPTASESIEVVIKKKPIANAGAPVTLCQGSGDYEVNDATADNYDTSVLTNINWSVVSGPATILNPNSLTPTIRPTGVGEIVLTLSVIGYSECNTTLVKTKTITIVPSPVITLPSTKTICEGTTLALTTSDVSVTNSSSVLWSASQGTFSPVNSAATTYTPAVGQTGLVNLNLTANSISGSGCSNVSRSIALTIIPKPIVIAGNSGTICESGTFAVTGASVQNSTLYSWSIAGPASFMPGTGTPNVFPLNPPVIKPDAGASGTVTVTLTATGNGVCPIQVSNFLTLQINPLPVVNAGTDAILCEGSGSYQLTGTGSTTITNTTYSWTETGGGSMQATANPLAPLYVPSASDFNTSNGINVITINLVATSNGCSATSDSMQLTLNAKPKVTAGEDLVSCGDDVSVSLLGARVSNYNPGYDVSWSSSDPTGTFNYIGSNQGINPTYYFGNTLNVTLTMTVNPVAGCPQDEVTSSITITQRNASIVATTNSISMCGETFTLPDLVTVSNSSNLLWTNVTGLSGTPGYFPNATTETPTFTPSDNEIANGFVDLKLTATSISSDCTDPATTIIRVNLQPKPLISAGGNLTKCSTVSPINLNFGASVTPATTYYWTENGTGTITANANTLQPTYTPGPGEIGEITFTLHAANPSPCSGETTATVKVTLTPQPTVSAGPDATVCNGTPYNLLNASTNSSTILWEAFTSISRTNVADGIFNLDSIENPTYTPGTNDIARGYVYLFMKASNPCSIVDDYMILTIAPGVGVYAGANASICEGSNYTLLNATAVNDTSFEWTSSENPNGTSSATYQAGVFNTPSTLNSTFYTPSANDIATGYVYLTLKGTGSSTCPIDTSVMKLNIVKKPTVSASDIQMCMSNTSGVALNGTGTNYNTLLWSEVSGPASGYINSGSYFTGLPSSHPTNEVVILRLVATPKAGCSVVAVKEITINIQALPIVEAGTNGATCYIPGLPIAPFSIIGSSLANSSSSNWTTSGLASGLFNLGDPVIYQSYSNSCNPETLTLTANGIGPCSSSSVSDSVTLTVNCAVTSLGAITPNVTTICQGVSQSFSVPIISSIQNYTWSVPTGSTIQSGQGTNSISVLFGANSGNVSVTGTNGCGSTIASTPQITVNTLPTGVSITGPQTVCAGATNLVYTASSIPNATTYVWTLPNGSTIITATNTITIAIGVNETSGNLSVAGNNSCGLGSSSSAFPITINPKPVLTSTLNPAAICSGTVFNYIPTTATIGSTFTWTRAIQPGISNVAASGAGSISETLINTTNTNVTVAYEITITTPQVCTNSQFISFTLYPAPSLTSNPTPNPICTGSTFNYTPSSSTSGTISWQRNATSGILETANNGTGLINEVLTNTTNSPITVTYLLTLPATTNGCTNATQITVPVVVNPNNTVSSASNTPTLCINTILPSITHTTTGATGIGTPTGLPAGVTPTWAANTITISGTPTVTGIFNYSIPLIGGCGSVNATGTITVNPNNTVTSIASNQTLCINTTLATITHTTTGATGIGTATGLPLGVTATWLANTITISGTPAASGTFNYNIPLTGGCGGAATGTITVIPSNTVTPAISTPTLCINTVLPSISHTTTGATGIGTATGLPPGVTASWASNTITISGTPTASGTFNYNIPLTGGCGSVNATGSIIVNPNNTVTSTTSNQTVCINTALPSITHTTTGATGIGAATSLPSGVTATWAGNIITISGTPTASGVFNYSIPLTGGCNTVFATGTITVNPNNTVTPSSGPQTLCINTILTTITHNTTGATGIGSVTGLPAGVTASWSANTITISGAPTAIGTFNYSITLTGGCNTINATGTIIVNPDNTVSSASSAQTLCINTILPSITHTTTGATGIGIASNLPPGVTASWLANTITISGAPTAAGTFNYSIPLTGGCNTFFATGSILVNPNNTVTPSSGPQTLCINTTLATISHTTTGATGIGTATGLPAGAIASWLANTITISGVPSASGTFNYNIPLTGGCGGAATGTITVIPSNTVTTATTPTLCINTVLPSFVHTTTGATGIGTATGLPAGVIASWATNTITISGAPTTSGTFNYSIPLTGGCSTINATGSIIVNPDNTVTSTTSNQTVCINTVLPLITHTTTGATGIGTATSLPSGVTATWAGNIITISGTPTASGIFNYSIPLTGGCNTVFATGTITVNPNNTVTPSSGPQTLCINTILTTITHNTTGATGIGSVTGLPAGVTASWSANTITISGAPTAIGTFNYSITLTGGCNTINATGTIIVNPDNTVSSASSAQTLCINTILPSITHTTTGATGIGIASNLPPGVTASWLANTITISGAPTAAGTFNYSIPLTGGCNTFFATGSILVNPNNTVTPSSGPQTLCINTTLATISHTTTGATGIGTATGLPAGAIASWLANTITISGVPSASGTFNYNIPLTGGCGGAATGTITVIPSNTVTTATTPTLCINTVLPSFVHTTTGATGIGTATGLPAGVIASWATNTITISGAPTTSGTFNYSIPLTGGCSTINATGSIIVNPDNTVTSTTSNQTVCINTVLPLITHTTTGATGIGTATSLPSGVTATWAGNIITISGTPTASGIFNYSIPLTGGCNTLFATGTITVNPVPVVNITNPAPACLPATVDITTTTTGSTTGLSYTYWNNSAATIALVNPSSVSISGTYYIKGTNSFGCSTISPVVVNINPSPTATITGQNSFIVCQNGTQPQITFTASIGTAPYTFTYQVISNGFTGPTQTVTTLGASTSSTISFPTTVSGNHTVTLLSVQDSSAALCNSTNITLPNTAFVTVQQVGTIIPINQAVVSQTVCQNTPITPIVFTIGGASTNAFAANLPNGLSGSYASGIFTISGTPLVTGIFNYVVNTSGSTNGCNSTYTGTITVNSNDSISILPPALVNQTVCNNVGIQPIVYSLGGGATGGIVNFSPQQPLGITWSIVSNVITISGASNTIGSFTYTVQSFGICGQSTASGNITINPSTTISLVSGNPNTTVCLGSAFPPIQYSITPATATMVVTGLPTGVTFNAATGIITGASTQSGTFSYSISSTTTCGNPLTGTIIVNPLQSIGYLSGNTNQVACQNTPIDPINFLVSGGVNTVTFTPALPAGINFNIVSGILTVSGTPTVATSVAQNYTITTQGSCGSSATYSITFDIRPEATITLTSGSGSINQSVCQSSAITPITFTIGGGATGVIFPNPMPNGVTWSFNAGTGVYTIQGNPLVNGIFNFPITTTGCPKTLFITISNVNTSVGFVLTSPVGTDNQTLCQTVFNSPIQPIIYNVIGATSITANGLPPGVTAVFSPTTGQLIISGTPLVSGVFNYTVTSQPCSIVKAGVIRVSTPISITNERVTNVSCSNINDGTISVDIVGGVSFNGLYAIRWTGPNGFQQNQTTITGLAPGTYVLSGTDAIGCPLPTVSYTVLPAQPIIISLQSSTNISCNGVLGCANFNITGGSGIYTDFTLQYLDPSLQTLVTLPPPANNNYFNICNLRAGVYYLTVEDSNNCSTIPYLFTIYDYSALSIENITMDDDLCQDNPGKIRIRVNSLDPNLTFFYNDILVPFVDLGNTIYELSINTPTTPFGIVKVRNSQNCWKEIRVSTAIISPDFEFTSNDYENYGYFSVNQSIEFTQLFNTSFIPAEYHYIVWDFGDNTPFKEFDNVEDLDLVDIENVFHTYSANGIYEITLTVYNRFGCSRKITKIIKVGTGATIMLPTIFTPNNDGINDYFRPSTIGLKKVAMFIYDKWGNLVYEFSSDVSSLNTNWGWDGIEKGKTEPINNDYRYYIIGTTINDKNEEKEGRFLLVK